MLEAVAVVTAPAEVSSMREEPDYRAVFHATPVLHVVLDPDFRIVDVNDAVLQATGRTREELVGRDHFETFPEHPDALKSGERTLRASFERVRETLRPDAMAVQKWDLPAPDGTWLTRYWSPSNLPVLVDGKLRYILHRVDDVTDFVLSRQAQQSNLDRMAADVLQRSQDLRRANDELRATQAELRELNGALEARVRQRTNALEQSNAALADEMAHRARMEAQFRQAQKMEAVGQLAGGIAHDFNNLLTVILGCVEGLRGEALSSTGRADLEEVRQAAVRAATLTSQLLAFSRRNVQAPEVMDLNELVRHDEPMLRRLIGENIGLAVRCGEGLGHVDLDRGLLEQALLNLVVNARDAMPGGGQLVVETREVELRHGTPGAVLGAPAGRYVELSVRDSGEGMAPDVRERIFLPFFTTKPVGKGTGLGLSMVHGAVTQARGEILVESTPGAGTTIRLLFPISDRPLGTRSLATSEVRRPLATERVLLVEDDASVRQVAQRALESEGYVVTAFGAPREALAWWRRGSSLVDLVLTDVVMPELDGPTLVDQLARIRGGFATLYVSGYTGGALLQRAASPSPESFLQKPFTAETLLQRVRAVLELHKAKGAASSMT